MSKNVELSWKNLKKMAKMYCFINPALSEYYLSRTVKMKAKARSNMSDKAVIPKKTSHCYNCFAIFKPGNHHIRLKPRKKMTTTVRKLLAKSKENPKQLGTFQRRMVDQYLQSKNKLIISCLTCKKTATVPCQSHEERIEQLFKNAPKDLGTEEKVLTKKQRKKEKKKKMKEKKKFSKYLFDNEEEALAAANKRNNIANDSTEQISVLGEQMQILTAPDIKTETFTDPVVPNSQSQPPSTKMLHNTSRSSVVSQKSSSKKKTSVVGVVKPNLISKKKKSRDLHQQLQKVLAADKQKKSGNSLQDFLTSL